MGRPIDASPNPFVGYVATARAGVPSPDPLDSPLAGVSETLSDAPFSIQLLTEEGVQTPLVHPQDMASGLLDTLSRDHETEIVARLNAAVRATQLETPRWHVLHDRLRTMQGWKNQVDALFEGTIAAPAAGASTSVAIPMINPLLPGNPGVLWVYPFVNFVAVGVQGTALTGLWSADILVNNQTVPCGVFSGLSATVVRPELLGAIYPGNLDQNGTLATFRISVLAGATITAATFYAQVSLSYAYRYIEDLPTVRQHTHALHAVERGNE